MAFEQDTNQQQNEHVFFGRTFIPSEGFVQHQNSALHHTFMFSVGFAQYPVRVGLDRRSTSMAHRRYSGEVGSCTQPLSHASRFAPPSPPSTVALKGTHSAPPKVIGVGDP